MTKRIIALLMAVVMTISVLPVTAFAFGATASDPSASGASSAVNFGVTGAVGIRIGIQDIKLPEGLTYDISSDKPWIKWFNDTSNAYTELQKTQFLQGNQNFYYYIDTNGTKFKDRLAEDKVFIPQNNSCTSFVSVNNSDVNIIATDIDETKGDKAYTSLKNTYIDMTGTNNLLVKFAVDKNLGFTFKATDMATRGLSDTTFRNFRQTLQYAGHCLINGKNTLGKDILNELFTPTSVLHYNTTSMREMYDIMACQTYLSMYMLACMTGYDISKLRTCMEKMGAGEKVTSIPTVLVEVVTVYKDTSTLKEYVVNAYQMHSNMMGVNCTYKGLDPLAKSTVSTEDATWTEHLLSAAHAKTSKKTCCGQGKTNGWKMGSWGFFRKSYGSWENDCDFENHSSTTEGHLIGIYNIVQDAKFVPPTEKHTSKMVGFSHYWPNSPVPTSEPTNYQVTIRAQWGEERPNWKEAELEGAGIMGQPLGDAYYTVTITGDGMVDAIKRYSNGSTFTVTSKVYVTDFYDEGSPTEPKPHKDVIPQSGIPGPVGTQWGSAAIPAAKTEATTDKPYISKVTMTKDELISFVTGETAQYFSTTRFADDKLGWKTNKATSCKAIVIIAPDGTDLGLWNSEDGVSSDPDTIRVSTPLKDGGYVFTPDESFTLDAIEEGTYWDWEDHRKDATYITHSYMSFVDPQSFLDDALGDDTTPFTVKLKPGATGTVKIEPADAGACVGDIIAIKSNDNLAVTKMAEGLQQMLSSGDIAKVEFTEEQEIKDFKSLITNKTPFGVTAIFVAGKQPGEVTWSFKLCTEEVVIEREGIEYKFYPDGSKSEVTKSYCGPIETPPTGASMHYNVTATPDAYELPLCQGHTGSNGDICANCSICQMYKAKNSSCLHKSANPYYTSEPVEVTVDLWGDAAAVANYKQIAAGATSGNITITITRDKGKTGTYEKLFQTTEQGEDFAALVGLKGDKKSGYINGKYQTYYTGVYLKDYTDKSMGTAMLTLLDKKQLKLKDEPFNTSVGQEKMLVGNYKVIISMTGKYKLTADSPERDFTITWAPSPKNNDDVSWVTPSEFFYFSELEQNYAEIKNGAILDEDFEAMAGTPSTRNMYFASGGNQFLVNATYKIAYTQAQRKYHYTAKPIICKYDFDNKVESKFNLSGEGSHPTSHKCFTAGGDGYGNCNQSSKNKHAHVSAWEKQTEGKHTKVDCDCACTHSAPCTSSCGDDCPGGHTKHGKGCIHPAGHCKYTKAVVVEKEWSTCVASATTWSFDSGEAPCGLYNCSAANQHKEDSCFGNVPWSIPGGYMTPSDNFEEAKEVEAEKGMHCGCHCEGAGDHNYEHSRHIDTYSETWWTLATDIYFMTIKDLKVWKLDASKLEGTEELFSDNYIIGRNTNDEPLIYVRKIKDVGGGSGREFKFNDCDANHISASGRIVYNWWPDSGDSVDLVVTAQDRGEYAGAGGDISKPLYTPDTCSVYHTTFGEISPYEKMHTHLKDHYLKFIESDTDKKGHRFGLTVLSDHILICANDSVLQSVYYHEYKAYAGYTPTDSEEAGISLHSIAKFDDDMESPNNQTSNNSDPQRTDGPNNYIHANPSSVSLKIDSAHWTGRANSQNSYQMREGSGKTDPEVRADWFWYKNKWCTEGGKIKNEDMYYGGYNGHCTTPDVKYDATKASNNHYRQNMTWDQLYTTELYKRWGSRSPQADANNGKKYVIQSYTNCLNRSSSPAPVTDHYALQRANLKPLVSSENGEYEFGDSYVFYKYMSSCEINYNNQAVYRYPKSMVRWAGAGGFEMPSIYTDPSRGSSTRWRGINNIIIFDPIATQYYCEVTRDSTCQPVIDDRDPAKNYGNDEVYNIEGDGILKFSLVGDFYQSSAFGLDTMSPLLGKGYYDGMDTEEWCKYKYITCTDWIIVDTDGDTMFNDEKIYAPGELIRVELFDNEGDRIRQYRFYLPELAHEEDNCSVIFNAEAVNDHTNYQIDNPDEHNREPEDSVNDRRFDRYHDCQTEEIIDVVGRIGNLTMTDSGDFRYSNFFKKMLDGTWLVPNVVYQVNESEQNKLLIDEYDIFGRKHGTPEGLWNTYGTQTHKGNLGRNNYYYFPLMPAYNNIKAFQTVPVRIGYDVYLDVETVGNYYSDTTDVTVKYSYYAMNKDTGKVTPVDVYMTNDLKYVQINDFDNVETDLYNYPTYLKWVDEAPRRQYTALEHAATEDVKNKLTYWEYDEKGKPHIVPYKAASGTSQYQGNRNTLNLDQYSRTFIGNYYFAGAVDGFNKEDYTNVGSTQDISLFERNSQKWYFSCGLPSSAVFVEAGKPCTSENMVAIDDNHTFLVVAAYIVAKGDIWTLIHDGSSAWGNLKAQYPKLPMPPDAPIPDYNPDPVDPRDPKPDPTDPIPPTPITIITIPPDTSRDDVDTQGTH